MKLNEEKRNVHINFPIPLRNIFKNTKHQHQVLIRFLGKQNKYFSPKQKTLLIVFQKTFPYVRLNGYLR